MKQILIVLTLMSVMISCCKTTKNDDTITMNSLLDEMIDRDIVSYFPTISYTQKQISSYDRRSIAPDKEGWFANDDGAGYERLEGKEKVMMDVNGPGVITRIWMTTKEKYGTMRFYIDGEKEPRIVVPAYDMRRFPIDIPKGLSLTHTHYVDDMGGVGGNSFFLPIPYSKSIKVTFEEPDLNVKIPRYYHINYRTYPEGTKVRSYTHDETIELCDKIVQVSETLLNPTNEYKGKELNANTIGQSVYLEDNNNGAIRYLEINVSDYKTEDYAEIMQSTQLKAIFDDVECVDVPLSDFSGAGLGSPAIDSWYLYSDGKGKVICRWVMPYQKSVKILLKNNSNKKAKIEIKAITSDYYWTENSLYFHCSHKAEQNIPLNNKYDTNNNLDWNFTTIKGRGVYCGDLLSLYNYAIDWYGEGDEKIWVDDDTFPSHFGTGTEDYFNCSWAPVVVFLTPYGGAPRADEISSHGYNAFMRTRNLDIIPFNNSFRFDIEMLSWNLGTADYYTTSYWYGDLDTIAL